MMSLLATVTMTPESKSVLSQDIFETQSETKKVIDHNNKSHNNNNNKNTNGHNNQQIVVNGVAQKMDEESVISQIGSFLKNLFLSEPLPLNPPIEQSPQVDNWQANYLSPVHTKLKKDGKINGHDKEKERDAEWLLKTHFKGILPYFRVWEIKMEELDQDIVTMGKGTPPRPNRPIFKRELNATKLFLKDYSKRRGMSGSISPSSSEEALDPQSLRRNSAPSFSLAAATRSLAPDQLIRRRRNSAPHRPSKLVT